MSSKKKKQEEIIKTHVLNLKEIREAEKIDKKERRKKIPGLFFCIGIILIVLGLCISFLIAKVFNNNPDTKPIKKDKNKLTCVSNLNDNNYLTKIHTETIYTFKSGKLYSSNINSSIVTNSEVNKINDLLNYFHTEAYPNDETNDQNNSIIVKTKLPNDNNKLIIDYSIIYNKNLDLSKTKVYDKYLSQPNLTVNDTYETVKKKSEKMGSLCN